MEPTEPTALRCQSCGTIAARLVTVAHPVRSLSLGRKIRAGELICDRCLQELEEERTEEEALRGPA
jgi:hypothetical protein